MTNVQKIMASLTAALLFSSIPAWADTAPAAKVPAGTTSNVIPGSIVAPITDGTHWTLHNFAEDKIKAALVESEYPTAIKAKIDSIDDQTWHVRIETSEVPGILDGEVYTLKFRAKADAVREIAPYGQTSDGDFHGIGLGENVTLGTDWQTYSQTFIASKATGHKATISFAIGQKPGTVWLSSVSLIRGANTSIKDPVSSPGNWVLAQKLPAVFKAVPEADSIKFIISSVSKDPWDLQAFQTGFMPVGGANYQITFTAKADSPRPMDISIIDMTVYQQIGFRNTIQLTTDWKVYSYVYNIPVGYRGLARLPDLTLGNKVGVVWLRNLSYTRIP